MLYLFLYLVFEIFLIYFSLIMIISLYFQFWLILTSTPSRVVLHKFANILSLKNKAHTLLATVASFILRLLYF
uniref:Uncharacterized protein n=1 Tax=Anguilla anguilla TaxID=7936 RepID=A0A0E9QKB8_ANGAN